MRVIGLGVLLLAGCPRRDGGNTGSTVSGDGGYAAVLQQDIEELLDLTADTSDAASTSSATADGDCTTTFGTCEVCFGVDGGPLSGTFGVDWSTLPCGTEIMVGQSTLAYDVTDATFDGTYDGDLGAQYEFTATGERHAALTLTGQTAEEWDASYTLDDFLAHTDGAEIVDYDATMSYTGFGGQDWTVDISGTTQEITGTVTGSNGGNCTISGSAGHVSASCEKVDLEE